MVDAFLLVALVSFFLVTGALVGLTDKLAPLEA